MTIRRRAPRIGVAAGPKPLEEAAWHSGSTLGPGVYTRACSQDMLDDMVKPTLADKLVVAISSRALFDLTDSRRVYTEAGVDAYRR
jgi:hypothetical protein